MPEHRARKRFGQHFLHDRGVVNRILDTFAPRPDETIVEIGPGLGALTQPLLERVPHLHVVELDRDLAARLRATWPPERLTVHETDALRFDFCSLATRGEKLRILGNLPYNISTPLLFHLLAQRGCIRDLLFMLQKEVVVRICAEPGGRDYGRLSVMLQWRFEVEKLFDVRPGAFTPPPKVDSSILRLVPRATPAVRVADDERFARLVQAAFAQRRKTLRNTLRDVVSESGFAAAGIDSVRRAETLTLAEFAALANTAPTHA
jgi:16S rRNA (adenine1518-N6/adenine1519-N6)-dimethyltransferase